MIEHDYNQFDGFYNYSYEIIVHLLQNDEMVWKLLYYPDSDAFSKPNLDLPTKANLIYKGQSDATPFRVFTVPFMDDSYEKETTQLRIFTWDVFPKNYVTAISSFAIDIFTHNKIAVLSTGKNRLDLMFEHIMKALNGKNIGSLGKLYFNAEASRNNRMNHLHVNKYYFGNRIIMSAEI